MTRIAAGLGLALVLAACTGSNEPLTFRYEDGRELDVVGQPQIWCGPYESRREWRESGGSADGLRDTRLTLHIERGIPKFDPNTPFWQLKAVVEEIETNESVRFPGRYGGSEGNVPLGASFFVSGPPEEEASTYEEESSGELTFSKLDCTAGAPIAFEVDAVAGSEFSDGSTFAIEGRFEATVGPTPAAER